MAKDSESKMKLSITATGPGSSGKTHTLLEIQRFLIHLGFTTSLCGDDHRLVAEKSPGKLYQTTQNQAGHHSA